jgi:hypothetical protein
MYLMYIFYITFVLDSQSQVKKLNSGRGFSPGTPASSITKTGHHDIAEILLKVALNTINQCGQHLHLLTVFSVQVCFILFFHSFFFLVYLFPSNFFF